MLTCACDAHEDPSTYAPMLDAPRLDTIENCLIRNLQVKRDRFRCPPLGGMKPLRKRFAVAPQHIELSDHHGPFRSISLALLPQPFAFRPERIELLRQRHRFAGDTIIRASAYLNGLDRFNRQGVEPFG